MTAHGPPVALRRQLRFPPVRWRRALPLVLVGMALAIGYGLGWHRYLTLDQLAASRVLLRDLGEQHFLPTLLVYVLAYAMAVTVSFPATWLLTVLGGLVFGSLIGAAAASVAATLGATLIFWATRSAFGDFLRRRASGMAARLADGFERGAFGYLLALRLVPVIPFFVLNIAPALFRVGFGAFIGATFLGILPGTFVYAYLGQSLEGVIQAAHLAGRDLGLQDVLTPEIALTFGALALLALVPILGKRLLSNKRPGS